MNGSIGDIKDAVIAHLNRDGRLQGTRLVKEFPSSNRSGPLKKPLIVVGISGVEVVPGGFGGYYGEKAGEDGGGLYGKTASVTMFFHIHCPPAQGGDACHQLYEILCDALVLEGSPFGFVRIWCDGVSGDKTTYSNCLRVCAVLRGAVTSQDTSLSIGSFAVRMDG